jgi:hypothetical protein
VDLARINRRRAIIGGLASAALIVSLLFLPWYSVDTGSDVAKRAADEWICGVNDTSCTGWETFPILRWLLLLAALAPAILAYIIVRGHKLSYPPGEMTMIAGFIATVLIAYNGIIDKPGTGSQEIGIGLKYGYWIAIVAAIAIGVTGFQRSMESGGKQARKAPGTV